MSTLKELNKAMEYYNRAIDEIKKRMENGELIDIHMDILYEEYKIDYIYSAGFETFVVIDKENETYEFCYSDFKNVKENLDNFYSARKIFDKDIYFLYENDYINIGEPFRYEYKDADSFYLIDVLDEVSTIRYNLISELLEYIKDNNLD